MHPPLPPLLDTSRYPIGKFVPPAEGVSPEARASAIQSIAELPGRLATAFAGLRPDQLETPYRDGGWTLRQLAHHLADSHGNAAMRLRLALTEDWPTIKPYEEARWAELHDARTLPVELSLALLAPLHTRWVALLQSLPDSDWERGYMHPESGPTSIETMSQLYRWHGEHHTAHILRLRQRMGW